MAATGVIWATYDDAPTFALVIAAEWHLIPSPHLVLLPGTHERRNSICMRDSSPFRLTGLAGLAGLWISINVLSMGFSLCHVEILDANTRVLLAQPGCLRVRRSPVHEDPSKMRMFVNSFDQSWAFAANADAYEPLGLVRFHVCGDACPAYYLD
ncbi:hypothetical protein Hte_010724 [Hypoxylon texense]